VVVSDVLMSSSRVENAAPWLGDHAGNLLQDLVVHSAGVGASGNAAPGDAALASESLSTVSPGVSGSYLLGPCDSSSPPIN
jgi:hypothetical protein